LLNEDIVIDADNVLASLPLIHWARVVVPAPITADRSLREKASIHPD
jgi:hypothetical protein